MTSELDNDTKPAEEREFIIHIGPRVSPDVEKRLHEFVEKDMKDYPSGASFEDHHRWVKEKAQSLIDELKEKYGDTFDFNRGDALIVKDRLSDIAHENFVKSLDEQQASAYKTIFSPFDLSWPASSMNEFINNLSPQQKELYNRRDHVQTVQSEIGKIAAFTSLPPQFPGSLEKYRSFEKYPGSFEKPDVRYPGSFEKYPGYFEKYPGYFEMPDVRIDPEVLKTPDLPLPDFEVLAHEGQGHVPFNEHVLKAQELMADMKKLAGDKLPGVNLGHFKNHSGTGADGLDGRFGKLTQESVMAVEKYLGIDPPTGKITGELTTKMQAKIDKLSPPKLSVEKEFKIPEPGTTKADPDRLLDPQLSSLIEGVLARLSLSIGTEKLLEGTGIKARDLITHDPQTGEPKATQKPLTGLDDTSPVLPASMNTTQTMKI